MMNPIARRIAVLATAAAVVSTACSGGANSSDTTSSRKRNAALNVGVTSLKKVMKIQSGDSDHVALTESGEIYAWGDTAPHLPVPPLAPGATRFVDIGVSTNTMAAFDDQNNLYAWGWNYNNYFTSKPSLPPGASRWTDLWMGHDFALLQDDTGTLTVWSNYPVDPLPALSTGATQVTKATLSKEGTFLIDDKGVLAVMGHSPYLDGENNELTSLFSSKKFVDVVFDEMMAGLLMVDTDGVIHDVSLDQRPGSSVGGNSPTLLDGAEKFVAADMCSNGRVALDDAGNIYGWSTEDDDWANIKDVPTPRDNGTKFVQVSMSTSCSASALDDAGNVYVWGNPEYGLSSIPPDLSSRAITMPISAGGNLAFGIEDNGTITEFGDGAASIGTFNGDNFISIANGPRHAIAVTSSGTLAAWGENESGQVEIPGGLSLVVQVAAGFAYSEALLSNGTVIEWGSHVGRDIVPMPDGLSGVKRIVSGPTHVLALRTDGTVVAWGDNSFGNADVPDGVSDVVSVAASRSCDAALKSDGSILYWGSCSTNQTSVDSVVGGTSLAATDEVFAAVKDDGSVIAWGEDNYVETAVPADLTEVVAVVGGNRFFLSVDKTGFVRAWGDVEGPGISIPSAFSGIDPSGEDWVPEEPTAEDPDGGQPYVYTDEDTGRLAEFILTLPPAQQKLLLEKLGLTLEQVTGNRSVTVTALMDAPKATVAAIVEQANAATTAAVTPTVSQSSASTVPPSRDPVLSVGATVTPAKAAAILGLKRASKMTFSLPKNAGSACSVSKNLITAKAPGTCTVTVKYTDAKKKKRTTTLALLIG